ncbi:MAG TPA: phosphocholine cytidylyltransferase family protein [Kiloniellales bacterium]|nr:phosphocholine cytidylyltransferase family protein [Kiloniellales bacterium]
MHAAMLAAGVGRRLEDASLPPKVLLAFGGESLLARHAAILRACGVRRLDLVVGYRAELIEAEIERIGARDLIRTIYNPDFEAGSVVSFARLDDSLRAGESVLFMDGDVLYDRRLLERLIAAPRDDCFLMDRQTGEGEDPVRLCLRDGLLVDFHKRPEEPHDWSGEWIGFARFGSETAARIADAAAAIVENGRSDAIYEEAIRDVLLAEPPGRFGVLDVTGLPWIEIDFPEDLERARKEIFPRVSAADAESEEPGAAGRTAS